MYVDHHNQTRYRDEQNAITPEIGCSINIMNKLCQQITDLLDDTPWDTFMTSFRLACLHVPDLTDLGKKIVVFNKIKGTMAHFKNSCLNPYSEDPNDPLRRMTFAEYLKEVQLKVSPKPDRTQAEKIYRERKQQKGEQLDVYLFDKYQLYLKLHEAMDVGHAPDFERYYATAIAGLESKELRYRVVGFVPDVKHDVRAFDKHILKEASKTLQLAENGDLSASEVKSNVIRTVKPPFMVDLINKKDKDAAHSIEEHGVHFTGQPTNQLSPGRKPAGFAGSGRSGQGGGTRQGNCFWCNAPGHWTKECWKRRAGIPRKTVQEIQELNEVLYEHECPYYLDEYAQVCELTEEELQQAGCQEYDEEAEIAELQRRGYTVQRSNNYRGNFNRANYSSQNRQNNYTYRARAPSSNRFNGNRGFRGGRNNQYSNRRQIHHVDPQEEQPEDVPQEESKTTVPEEEQQPTEAAVNHLGIHQLAYTSPSDPYSEDEDYTTLASKDSQPRAVFQEGNMAIVGTGTSRTFPTMVWRQEQAELSSILDLMQPDESL